jgi:glucose dehydrogenase
LRHARRVTIALVLLAHSVDVAATDWTHHGADAANSKYAPVAQINADNLDDVRIVWH